MRIIESIQAYLRFLKETVAESAAATVETGVLVAQIADTLPAITRALSEVVTRLDSIDERLNRYIGDQARQEGKVARIDRHISEVRQKLGIGQGQNGG